MHLSNEKFLFNRNPPGGITAAHPPLAVWPFVIEFLFGGFFAFLGVLGILAKHLEKIVPEPSQIEPLEKIVPERSHMEPRGVKNRARGL